MAGMAMLIAVPVGQAAWRSDGGTPLQWLGTVAITGAVLLPAALVEELMFRGVPLVALSGAFGRLPAIPTYAFAAMVAGGLWATLWGTRWRLLGEHARRERHEADCSGDDRDRYAPLHRPSLL